MQEVNEPKPVKDKRETHSVPELKQYIAKLKPTFLAKLIYYLFPSNREVVLKNMHYAFADVLTAQEYQKLAQAFYAHMLSLLKELIQLRFLKLNELITRVDLLGKEHAFNAFKKEKGVIWLTGHLGNWEFAPLGGRLQVKSPFGEFRVYLIRKKIPWAFLEKILFGRLERAGVYVIPKDASLRQTIRALSKNDVVTIAFDQYVRVGARGISTNFFGHSVGTYRVLAKLGKVTVAPIIPVAFYRLNSGQHVCEFYPEIKWISHDDPEEEIRLNTEAYNQFIEDAIWKHPDQWQWRQRRWRVIDD